MHWYKGSLSRRKKLPLVVRKAQISLRAQRSRCTNPNDHNYKNYGAKGIKVEYETRVFVGWYIKNFIKLKLKDPTVGRIDHSKNYSIDNIEMQERSENSRERNIRIPQTNVPKLKHRKKIVAFKDNEPFLTCFSIGDAAIIFQKAISSISSLCSGRNKKTKEGINFKYLKDIDAN